MFTLNCLTQNKSFGGLQLVYSHASQITQSEMRFAIYLPPNIIHKAPCLLWLSGLTCTEQNFITKACAQRAAARLGVIIVVPDVSPRGIEKLNTDACFNLGEGAGFYLDATEMPWSEHYQMYSYITKELYNILLQQFPIDEQRIGIFGHSMGGLGALNLALRNPHLFKSVSAFAPICAPMQSAFAIKAFTAYLGTNEKNWQQYDPISLITSQGWKGNILIDQGTQDEFLERLNPQLFELVCLKEKVKLQVRWQEGYDHGYYFIASFIDDHIQFHLNQ